MAEKIFYQDGKPVRYDDTLFEDCTIDEPTKMHYLKYIGKETDGSKIDIPPQLTSMCHMFEGTNIQSMPTIPNTIVDMSCAFRNCQSLEIDNKSFIPNTVRNMSFAFNNCKRIESMPRMGYQEELREGERKDGSKYVFKIYHGPTDLTGAFAGCNNLRDVYKPLSGVIFDYAFAGTSIDHCPDFSRVSNWDLSVNHMCDSCPRLQIDGSEKFNDHAKIEGLFENCKNITKEQAMAFLQTNFGNKLQSDVSRNFKMNSIFHGCEQIYGVKDDMAKEVKSVRKTTSVNASKQNIKVVRVKDSTFESVNVAFKTRPQGKTGVFMEKVIGTGKKNVLNEIHYDETMFTVVNGHLRYVSSYTYEDENGEIKQHNNPTDLSKINLSDYIEGSPEYGLTDMTEMFDGATITAPPKIPPTVRNMDRTFRHCHDLKFTGNEIIPESVLHMSGTYGYCTSTEKLPSVPENVTDISSLAHHAVALTEAPLLPSKFYEGDVFKECFNRSNSDVQNDLESRIRAYNKLKNEPDKSILVDFDEPSIDKDLDMVKN